MINGQIRLIAMDVDGVLTDGSILLGTGGFEAKLFNVRDGLGISVLRQLGYPVAWITGRSSEAVMQRAQELKISYLRQGVVNKVTALNELLTELKLGWDNLLYIGDDLNDLAPFSKAGVACTTADGSQELKEIAHYITGLSGGQGAVREIIEWFLKQENRWSEAVGLYLKTNRLNSDKGEVQ